MTIATSYVTTGAGNTVYTSGGNTAITWLSMTNYGNATAYANVWVVPSGQSASNVNLILANLAILSSANTTGGDTFQFYLGGEKLLLANGDSIIANCSSNILNAVTSYTTI
jgi:phage gp45-like